MKKVLFALCLLLAVSACKSKKKAASATKTEISTNKRIPIADADPQQKQRAYDFGKRVLSACNTSRFKAFNSSEATASVIQNTTESKITKTCHKFRLKYGDFKDLTLVEIIPNKKDNTNMYRYKAHYSKKIANKELRVTMNDENKLTGIKSTDWKEKYQPIE